jgi:hypothetical protein
MSAIVDKAMINNNKIFMIVHLLIEIILKAGQHQLPGSFPIVKIEDTVNNQQRVSARNYWVTTNVAFMLE